jgi:intergrase/recombinase
MLRPGFEPGICDSKDLPGFKSYLLSQNLERKTALELYRYGSQYNHVINTGDASNLLTLSDSKRRHVMKGLTAYSKWIGKYDKWQKIKSKYQIKWSNGISNNLLFHNIIDNTDTDKMTEWVIQMINDFPRFSNILRFNIMTGLRPQEAIDSFNILLSHKRQEYLSDDKKLLQHFKFPDLFLRRTKKAFISVVNDNILSLINGKELTYEMIRLNITRKTNTTFNMAYCRKIFATFLRNEGIESEIIDLLQGRIPNSIFVRHYYRPQLETVYNRVAGKLDKLNDLVTRYQLKG